MSLLGARRAKRILVVEDNSLTRAALLIVLSAQGYEIEGAADGQEALAYLKRREQTDLILLDLTMPRMDGWQFLEQRQRNPGLAGIPVIVLSAEDRAVGSEVRCLGADDFLSKPVDPEVLLQVVGRYCGGGDEGRVPNPLPRKGGSPMSGTAKVGDRVRVTAGNHVSGYQPGDTGTVLKLLENPARGDIRFYVVAMDKDHIAGGGMAFAEGEVEADL
jgi:CheY-like chemotaxis protein